jgi:hypothetical protein
MNTRNEINTIALQKLVSKKNLFNEFPNIHKYLAINGIS